ncbi:MAG TPA: hypothetical protein VEU62_14280 [Bryobacterales bacterium]|nr:hypothetical protein [Bryobacterales bacterium]
MRLLAAVCTCLVFPGFVCCQTPSSAEEVVSRCINSGAIDGHADKLFSRIGDSAAVAITKVLGDKDDLTMGDIDGALTVIRLSFSAPGIVEVVADREPRTTLFVLRYLDRFTGDAALRRRIAETKKYVLEQSARIKRN